MRFFVLFQIVMIKGTASYKPSIGGETEITELRSVYERVLSNGVDLILT